MANLYIIAGPNGAGKTTSAKILVGDVFYVNYFINADEIARAINPLNPDKSTLQAGKLMLTQMDELVHKRKDFAFETTLSARSYVNLITKAKKNGYKIHLVFMYLKNIETAKKRVQMRVLEGGHNIPEHVIIRRYWAGLYNLLHLYIPIVDHWVVYDNSAETLSKVAFGEKSDEKIIDSRIWNKIQKGRI